ncbi:hypothetical protein [Kitasatospora sp. NPDC059571]|uniref:hypothetical protein n=1 Tax=Kitasatospora sp. NPDC059571 TaxID=3346871 RepID=UPI0036ACDDCA
MTTDVDDQPWISVRPDTSAVKGLLIKASPLILFGAIRIGLMMARGRGTSEGSGPLGLLVGVLAVAFPLLWVAALLGLRSANARILLDEGVLTVRNIWGRPVLAAPLASITGVHAVRLPVDGPHKDRVVITAEQSRPVLIDVRHWQQDGLRQLWQHLGVPVRDHGPLTWAQLRARIPGTRVPWRQVHYVLFTVLLVVAVIAYIALVVNLPFLL